jgi:hypothetical protein
MGDLPATLQQFQSYIWEQLPPRRTAAGREVVADIVALAVQEWPVEELSTTEPGSKEEAKALQEAVASIKRQAEFMYGQKRFAGLWIIALQILVPIIVQHMLEWWRRRKDNKRRLLSWRRKWRTDG